MLQFIVRSLRWKNLALPWHSRLYIVEYRLPATLITRLGRPYALIFSSERYKKDFTQTMKNSYLYCNNLVFGRKFCHYKFLLIFYESLHHILWFIQVESLLKIYWIFKRILKVSFKWIWNTLLKWLGYIWKMIE